jgi:SAM-dependent methyltransferase
VNGIATIRNSDKGAVDIDDLYQPTFDERSRQGFVSALRDHAKTHMRGVLRSYYEEVTEPEYRVAHGHAPQDGEVVEQLTRDLPYYRFYSSLRYNAQEMMYLSTIPAIERRLPEMVALASEIAERSPAGGSLRIDPDFEVPGYVADIDVHLVPGSFHAEYGPDDVAQAVMVAQGGRVSTGANTERKSDPGNVGRSIAYWLSRTRPDFKPRRILDLGTQSGKNLLPYLDIFPDAEAYGVDVSAPSLRYGHAKAEFAGKAVHLSQQSAEAMDFPDGHFDLVVSSFFFHEIPLASTRRVLAECSRLLAPGGATVHMELPPRALCDPWLNFYWDWDARYNNEPSYVAFRSADVSRLMVEAGFAAGAPFMKTVPNVATFDPAAYPRFLSGEIEAPLHGRGGWFVFGAWN